MVRLGDPNLTLGSGTTNGTFSQIFDADSFVADGNTDVNGLHFVRRTVTIEEVGETAAFMLSPMSRGITGEILHVDAGYHVVGMKNPAAPDISVVSSD